jgi:hypothetical protein
MSVEPITSLSQAKRRGAQEPKPTSRMEEQHQQTNQPTTAAIGDEKKREGGGGAEEEREREAKVEEHTQRHLRLFK